MQKISQLNAGLFTLLNFLEPAIFFFAKKIQFSDLFNTELFQKHNPIIMQATLIYNTPLGCFIPALSTNQSPCWYYL